MKKIIALLTVLILITLPVVSFSELSTEEKALVKTTVRNMNKKIAKVQTELDEKDETITELKEELKEKCLDVHEEVLDKMNDLEKRLDALIDDVEEKP